MFRNLSRAQQRFLGLTTPLRTRSDEEAQPTEHVTFTQRAQDHLRRHLYASGAYRGGPLFGFRSGGDLAVQFIAPSGYTCGDPDLQRQPLRLDERYVLGWSDCLCAQFDGKLDWVGNWLMYPDSQLASVESDVAWLREGLETDLFNEAHVLLCVGWEGGVMNARAYGYHRQVGQLLTYTHDLAGET